MQKIYYVIAHLTNGDVRIARNRASYVAGQRRDMFVDLPGFLNVEEAQRVVDAYKETFHGVDIEIVPNWWNMDGSREEIIDKAENGRWCPVTVEKLEDAIRKKLDATTEDSDCIDFLCKNKLCRIYTDEEGNYHFQVEDLNGEVKEKTLPINLDWFNLYTFKPTLCWRFSMEAAKIFLELLKK